MKRCNNCKDKCCRNCKKYVITDTIAYCGSHNIEMPSDDYCEEIECKVCREK